MTLQRILSMGMLLAASALLSTTTTRVDAFVPHPQISSSRNRCRHQRMPALASTREDSFDMDDLASRMADFGWDRSPHQNHDDENEHDDLHICLFHPNQANQGVHSIEYPKGSGRNVILAFSSPQACDAFCRRLRAQAFFFPTPHRVNRTRLAELCQALGVQARVVPPSVDLIPPRDRVSQLGHDRHLPHHARQLQRVYFGTAEAAAASHEGALVGGTRSDCWE